MTRHAWTFACWAVLVLGVAMACRGPKPAPPPEPKPPPSHDFGESSREELVRRGQALDGFAWKAPPSLFRFDLNSAEVRQPREVRGLAAFLARTEQSILLEGHACPLGSADYNLALGYHRAAAVREALTAAGVPPRLIRVTSLGETHPLTLDPAGYAANRRVEVHFQ